MTETAENEVVLLLAGEAAEQLRVPETWLYSQARRGTFPCVRVGRWVRFRQSDVDEFIANGGMAATSWE